MKVPGQLEPYARDVEKRPDGVKMVRISTEGLWTKKVELVQEARKSRDVSKAGDSITQSAIDNRMASMTQQLTGRQHLASSSSSSGAVQQSPNL